MATEIIRPKAGRRRKKQAQTAPLGIRINPAYYPALAVVAPIALMLGAVGLVTWGVGAIFSVTLGQIIVLGLVFWAGVTAGRKGWL